MKKFISIILFIFIASGAFAQFGGYNYLQVYNTLRFKNRFITSINNDTSFVQNDSFSIPTSWAVYKYFQNKLDSLALSGGQVNSDWNATSGVQQILNKPTIYTKAQVDSITSSQTLDQVLGRGNASTNTINLNGSTWTDGLWVDSKNLVTVNGFISQNTNTSMWMDGINLMYFHPQPSGRYYDWDTIKYIRPYNLAEEPSASSTIYFPLGSGTLVTKVNGVPADSTGNVPLPFSNTLDQVLINGNSTNHNIVQTNGAYISQSDLSGWGASLQPGSWDLGTPDGKNLLGLSNQLRWDDSTFGGNSLSIQRLRISNQHDTLLLPDRLKGIFALSVNGNIADSTGNITISVGSTQKVDTTNLSSGMVKSNGAHSLVLATAGTDYVVPSGNITGTAAGFTGSLGGDVSGTQSATSVNKINGITLSSLTTGLLKNTTGTGQPSIAVGGTDYMRPGVDSLSALLLKKDGNKVDTSLLPSINLDSLVFKWSGNTALFRPTNATYDYKKSIRYDSASGTFNAGAISATDILYSQMGSNIKAEPITGNITNANTANNLSSGTTNFVTVVVKSDTTISDFKWIQKTQGVFLALGAGWEGAGLYSVTSNSYTLIDSTGASDTLMWKSVPGIHTKSFTTSHRLTRGVYAIGILYRSNGAATTVPQIAGFSNNSRDEQQASDYANGFKTNCNLSYPAGNLPPTGTLFSSTTSYGIQFYLALD